MRHQPLTDVARAVDDVDNAVGQPGIRHDLHEVGHRDRRPLGWLDHDRVADGDTRRDELDRDERREVPRRDRGVDAVRLAEREDPLRRVLRRDDRRLHPLHVFRRDAEVLRGLVDVAESLARVRLALLERQLAREPLAPLIDQVRDRVTDAPAIPGRERSPFRLSLARRGNRPIDVFCARIRRLRERLTRYRRDDLPGAVAGRGDPLAADEVVQGADGDRHAGIFLHRRPTSRLELPTRVTGFETSAGAAAATSSEPEDEYGFAGEAVGEWSRVWRRFIRHRLAFASLILLVVVSAAGLLAAHIAPYAAKLPGDQAATCAFVGGKYPTPTEATHCLGPNPTVTAAGHRVYVTYAAPEANASQGVRVAVFDRSLRPLWQGRVGPAEKT